MHNPCGGTDSSGLVGTESINLEFSVNSVFVKPPFVEYPTVGHTEATAMGAAKH